MTFPEMMFYAEAEGLLPTRLGCLNAVINDIKELPYSEIEFSEFKEILRNNGLSLRACVTNKLYIGVALALFPPSPN